MQTLPVRSDHLMPFPPCRYIDSRGENGLTALHLAAYSGSLECIRILLDAGASMMVRTVDLDMQTPVTLPAGSTPLHAAAMNGHVAILQAMMQVCGAAWQGPRAAPWAGCGAGQLVFKVDLHVCCSPTARFAGCVLAVLRRHLMWAVFKKQQPPCTAAACTACCSRVSGPLCACRLRLSVECLPFWQHTALDSQHHAASLPPGGARLTESLCWPHEACCLEPETLLPPPVQAHADALGTWGNGRNAEPARRAWEGDGRIDLRSVTNCLRQLPYHVAWARGFRQAAGVLNPTVPIDTALESCREMGQGGGTVPLRCADPSAAHCKLLCCSVLQGSHASGTVCDCLKLFAGQLM